MFGGLSTALCPVFAASAAFSTNSKKLIAESDFIFSFLLPTKVVNKLHFSEKYSQELADVTDATALNTFYNLTIHLRMASQLHSVQLQHCQHVSRDSKVLFWV